MRQLAKIHGLTFEFNPDLTVHTRIIDGRFESRLTMATPKLVDVDVPWFKKHVAVINTDDGPILLIS